MPLSRLHTSSKIRILISVCFIVGILFSFNLWHNDRNFPLFPLVDLIDPQAFYISYIGLGLMLALLLANCFFYNKWILAVLISLIVVLLLQDQMRWQPWVYMYVLILTPLLFDHRESTEVKRINYWQLIFIGMYFWTGIHKFNPNFTEVTFRSILVELFNINNAIITKELLYIGFALPLIEIAIGIFLIIPKYRKWGVQMAILTHLFIMVYVYSFGAISNSVVYPWNIASMLCVYFLFNEHRNAIILWKEKELKYRTLNLFIITIVGIAPLLNFFNKWDTFLAFSLYSAKHNSHYILLNETEASNRDLNAYYTNIEGLSGGAIVDVNLWAYKELNVPFYPEDRLFNDLLQKFCDTRTTEDGIVFVEFDIPLWDRYLYQSDPHAVEQFQFLHFETPISFSEAISHNCVNLD